MELKTAKRVLSVLGILLAFSLLLNTITVTIVISGMIIVFNLLFWKCPQCGRHLKTKGWGSSCPYCGSKINGK